jgi:drug/metabolite transporter (DMT)-like permease
LDARHRADLALLLVTLLWGLTFPLIRSALQDLDPFWFIALRFALAALVFLPLLLSVPAARAGLRRAWLPGLALAVIAWASYFSQVLGLRTVGAGRAAFITGTSVILVPLMSPLFRAGRPGRIDLVAALVATLGMYLLTDPRGSGFTSGDAWILLCAVMYAVYIHTLQKVLRSDPHELSLAFVQIAGVGLCASLLIPAAASGPVLSKSVVIALLFCAVFATVGTFWLQTRYQRRTTPERVALIFAMEPVFASVFAYLLLGETLGLLAVAGGLLILVAVIGAELLTATPRATD